MASYPSDNSMPGAFAGPDDIAATGVFEHQEAPIFPEHAPASHPQLLAAPPAHPPQHRARPAAIPLSMLQGRPGRRSGIGEMAPVAGEPAVRPGGYYAPQENPDFKSRGHMLGFATVAVGLGAVLGARLGGAYGGVAGTLFAGAATNGYRALLHGIEKTPEGKREALISGTWAVVAAGAGGYLLYVTRKKSSAAMTPNPDDDDGDCAKKNGRRSCGIRAII